MAAGGEPSLRVRRRVLLEVAAEAARSVPGVVRLRRGPALAPARRSTGGVEPAVPDDAASLRVWIVAAQEARLGRLGAQVRRAVGEAVRSETGLSLREITVVIDGLGS